LLELYLHRSLILINLNVYSFLLSLTCFALSVSNFDLFSADNSFNTFEKKFSFNVFFLVVRELDPLILLFSNRLNGGLARVCLSKTCLIDYWCFSTKNNHIILWYRRAMVEPSRLCL
jgi:hypothetical protein